MNLPRYRTLDGDEIDLPLAMNRWVLVPRELARFDPELAWTLDYDDAPAPEDADQRLDFSAGALLVPVERWNEHAALEPNLAPCRIDGPFLGTVDTTVCGPTPTVPLAAADDAERIATGASVARLLTRAVTVALVALAVAYVGAVGVWLWSLRHQISGPDLSMGLLLVGAAMLLAWIAGVAGAAPGTKLLASTSWHRWDGRTASLCHQLAEHPLLILRLGFLLQITGFVALVALH